MGAPTAIPNEPNRFLTRRNFSLLFMIILLGSLLILTNEAHHWVWTGFSDVDGRVYQLRGVGYWVLVVIGYFLAFLNLPVLTWLFIRSPLHRWPVALILSGQVAVRAALLLVAAGPTVLAPWHPVILAATFQAVVFAIALFGFQIFDPIPMARARVITQMREGMLVLDTDRKIVELNPAAERLLRQPGTHLRGRDVAEFLPARATQSASPDNGAPCVVQAEVSLGPHVYDLQLSPLTDWDGEMLGHLVLLRDVTEQKRARAQILEQQRALGMLSERERLARELHDSLGQVLGFTSLKMEAVRKLVADSKLAAADEQLTHLESIVAEAHADVREYILNLRAAPNDQQPFFSALRHYLDGFRQNYGIRAELCVGEGVEEGVFAPGAQMQVFRIIQEAFSNARKHAGASGVKLSFEMQDEQVRITIQDDGQGFDPAQATEAGNSHFGLRFMRERAGELGGSLRLHSTPGLGTCVELDVPVKIDMVAE